MFAAAAASSADHPGATRTCSSSTITSGRLHAHGPQGLAIAARRSNQISCSSGAQDYDDAGNGSGGEGSSNFPIVTFHNVSGAVRPKYTDDRPYLTPDLVDPTTRPGQRSRSAGRASTPTASFKANDGLPCVASQAERSGPRRRRQQHPQLQQRHDNCQPGRLLPCGRAFRELFRARPERLVGPDFMRIITLDDDLDNSNNISVGPLARLGPRAPGQDDDRRRRRAVPDVRH